MRSPRPAATIRSFSNIVPTYSGLGSPTFTPDSRVFSKARIEMPPRWS